MAVKAHEMYQGDDWVTYRPTVAQAFDTLDRMYDLCHERIADVSAMPSDLAWSPHREIANNLAALCGAASSLCDDLAADLDAVLAELSPHLQNDAIHRWMGFEMQLHLKAIRALVDGESPMTPQPTAATLDEVISLIERIRSALRLIDQ